MGGLRHEYVRWPALEPARRATLEAEVRELLPRVFDGLPDDQLDAFVRGFGFVDLLRDPAGRLVGLNSVRFLEVTPEGFERPVSVLNHFAGMLPEHRGGNAVMGPVIREGFRHWFSRGCRSFYYACRFIHPSPYRLFVTCGSRPFPTPTHHTSEEHVRLLHAFGEALGYPVERSAAGLVVTRPVFRVRGEAPLADRYADADPVTRFFVDQCPRYRDGQGLVVLMPLGWRAAVEVPARFAWRRLTRALRPAAAG